MIAELFPGCYDAVGRKVLRPDLRRHGVQPTFSLGRYTSHPLTVHCKTIEEVRKFLSTCKPVSDKEQFGRDDYWQPPEDFEKRRKGDCDDYALWGWRQFLDLGYQARFVMGRSGRLGIGHAWVSIERAGKQCLVEPQRWYLGDKLPLLSVATYKPEFSVEWDGKRIHWYQHKQIAFSLPGRMWLPALWEWATIWGRFWVKISPRLPIILFRKVRRRFFKKQPEPCSVTGVVK